MKISIIADIHLNNSLYKTIHDRDDPKLPFRVADFLRSFEHMVDENINVIKPDLIVLAGDIYESYDPPNTIRAFFYTQCMKISEAGISLAIIVGNHDICKEHHALLPLMAMSNDNIKIYDEPYFVEFKNKNLMFFPYSLSVENGSISLRQQFYDFIESCEAKRNKDKETLFFGHFGVKGATLKTIEKKENKKIKIKSKSDDNIHIEDLENINADYIFLGDYHEHQILPVKNAIAMYTGSIEKSDMSECNQKKGYVVFDDNLKKDSKMGETTFKEYPKCRPMLELKGNVEEILSQIESVDESLYQNAIVKISFVGVRQEFINFSIHLSDIKSKIQKKFNAIHIYGGHKCIDNVIKDNSESNEDGKDEQNEKIIDKGYIDEELVLEVVQEMISEKESDKAEQEIIIKMAKEIYKETKESTTQ